MKKIILATSLLSVISTSLLADKVESFEEAYRKAFLAKNDIVLRIGVDALGGEDDVSGSGLSKLGSERDMGFEVAIGAEEKVADFEWGYRRMMTLYSYGETTYYNGSYKADILNSGIETTAATYFKATQYFKPYMGIGVGLNINSYDDHGQYRQSDDYQFSVHAVGGVSGVLFSGLGYYAEYKYRFAPSETLQVTPIGSSSVTEIKNDGVNGGVFMAGLSYQF